MRSRTGGDLGAKPLQAFLEDAAKEIASRDERPALVVNASA